VQHYRQGHEKSWDKYEWEGTNHPIGNFGVDQVKRTGGCQYGANYDVRSERRPSTFHARANFNRPRVDNQAIRGADAPI
jgi:hypothetical protein